MLVIVEPQLYELQGTKMFILAEISLSSSSYMYCISVIATAWGFQSAGNTVFMKLHCNCIVFVNVCIL